MYANLLINHKIKEFENPHYLEIGVRNGETFFSIKTSNKFGVDPDYFFSKRFLLKSLLKHYNWRYKMFREESDSFFMNEELLPKYKISVAFIDGLHTYEQSLKDARNCLRHLGNNGTIIFHDCNPQSEEASSTQLPKKSINWNGDVWKTIYQLRTLNEYFDCFTIDTDQGLGVLKTKVVITEKILALLTPSESVRALTYDDFDKDRKQFIGLTNLTELNINNI